MAILEILTYPNPVLRKKSIAVEKVTPELKKLAEDMLETMYASRGIGLAAPQVGQLVRLLVLDTRPKEGGRYKMEDMTEMEQKVQFPIVIFNPVIHDPKGKTSFDEGCLSVPGYFETVNRAHDIRVTGLDIHGKPLEIKTDGLLAICFQHEMDHLEGKLFIDRLSPIKSERIKAKIKKEGYPTAGKNQDDEDSDVAL